MVAFSDLMRTLRIATCAADLGPVCVGQVCVCRSGVGVSVRRVCVGQVRREVWGSRPFELFLHADEEGHALARCQVLVGRLRKRDHIRTQIVLS